jgi:hypothetical protein
MRPVSFSAVSVAGKFAGSIDSLDLRCVACGFNEMPAVCAPVFGEVPAHPGCSPVKNVETPALSPLGERAGDWPFSAMLVA